MHLLYKRDKGNNRGNITYLGNENKGTTPNTTLFIEYYKTNKQIILDALHHQIYTITKDTKIASNNLEYRFLKYLLEEYNILIDG